MDDTFSTTAAAIIEGTQTLEIFDALGRDHNTPSPDDIRLPSWVPDWRRKLHVVPIYLQNNLPGIHQISCGAGTHIHKPTTNPRELIVTGKIVACVHAVVNPSSLFRYQQKKWQEENLHSYIALEDNFDRVQAAYQHLIDSTYLLAGPKYLKEHLVQEDTIPSTKAG